MTLRIESRCQLSLLYPYSTGKAGGWGWGRLFPAVNSREDFFLGHASFPSLEQRLLPHLSGRRSVPCHPWKKEETNEGRDNAGKRRGGGGTWGHQQLARKFQLRHCFCSFSKKRRVSSFEWLGLSDKIITSALNIIISLVGSRSCISNTGAAHAVIAFFIIL